MNELGILICMCRGPDGEWGYGGSCFPKDTRAFVHYANSQQEPFDLLERVVNLNEKYRQK